MAIYQTVAGDKLYNIAQQLYGEISDRAIVALIINNPIVWDGQGVLDGGITLNVPETIPDLPYNPNPPDYITATKNMLERANPPETAAIGFTKNMSARDGSQITESKAVEQDIVDRVLSYRLWREWRPNYGTRVLDAFKYNLNDLLITAAVNAARNALAPAANRYTVNSITGSIDFDERILTLHIIATPSFGTEPVETTIPIQLPDLS